MDYLNELRNKIRLLHSCDATHRQTVPIKEVFKGKIIWKGQVEVFDLYGHAKAKRCYAWGYPDEKQPDKLDVVAVLEIPPVVSPETAVKAAVTVYTKSRAPFPKIGMT
jgi:hypothetical protein